MQGYFGEDCSNEATHLQWDAPVSKEEASFECATVSKTPKPSFVEKGQLEL